MSKSLQALWSAFFILLSFMSALAQKAEIQPFIGYRFSDSFSMGPVMIGGNPHDDWNEFIATSGISYGVTAGYFISNRVQIEFLWSRQNSSAEGRSAQGSEATFADMKVDNYHGNLLYHWGDADSRVRPFVFGGVGATSYNPSGYYDLGSVHFSTDWGGGVKFFANKHLGLRVQGRWIPTYIGATTEGVISAPYAKLFINEAVFHHQLEITAGAVFRF